MKEGIGAALTLATLTVLRGVAGSSGFWRLRVGAVLLLLGLPFVLRTPAVVLLAVLVTLLVVVVAETTLTGLLARSPGPEGAGLEVDRSECRAALFVSALSGVLCRLVRSTLARRCGRP